MLVSRYWYKSIFDRVAPIPILRGPGQGPRGGFGIERPMLGPRSWQQTLHNYQNALGPMSVGRSWRPVRLWQLLSVRPPPSQSRSRSQSPPYNAYPLPFPLISHAQRPYWTLIVRLSCDYGVAEVLRMEASPPWQLRCLCAFFLIKFNWLNIWFTASSNVSAVPQTWKHRDLSWLGWKRGWLFRYLHCFGRSAY